MASEQRIFPRLTANALSFVRKPVGALGLWDQVSSVYSSMGARYAGPVEGSAQAQAVPRFNAVPTATTKSLMIVQFISDPMRDQHIDAGSWQVAFAAQLANAGATFTWGGRAALFVLGATSGLRAATIFDVTAIGSAARAGAGELTCLASVVGNAVQLRGGDCLCLELGIAVHNTGAGTVPVVSLFTDGAGPITSDGVAAVDAAAVLEASVELLLSLPQAGEPPGASVTHKDAVAILKESWPPRTGSLYDWDNDQAIVHKLFEAFGDVIKLYGFDQSDRLFRELNPLTTVELLPAWESLLGIIVTNGAARLDIVRRRNNVLARLRETGPLTVFNLAAIFARLAGYVPPAVPEVIFQSPDDIAQANYYKHAFGGVIPTGTGFDGSNLILTTPTLLDGGKVWDAGANIFLFLTAAQSANLHIQLTGPSGVSAVWGGGPNLSDVLVLRSPAHAGAPIHGNWTLSIYRDVGSPAVTLVNWWLLTLGKGWGGRASARFRWEVYLDPAHQTVSRRDIETTLDRVGLSYTEGFCVFDKTSIPGTNTHRAGRFLAGA